MKVIAATLKKELLQLIRNRVLVFLVFICPVIILGIIPFAIDNNVQINAAVVDYCKTSSSRDLLFNLSNPHFFSRLIPFERLDEAEKLMERGELDLIMVIPHDYSPLRTLTEAGKLTLIFDGTLTHRALHNNYIVSNIIEQKDKVFNTRLLFNRDYNYKHYSLISLIILVVTLVGTCLMTLNIVQEKESGILEQFNSTVLNKNHYICAKFIFFTLLALIEISASLLFCRFAYGLKFEGSIFLYFLSNTIFMFPMLGIGLLISSLSKNQVQAVYLLTFILLNLIMLSTMFTHLSSMPAWARILRFINPIYFNLETSRLIAFKGVEFAKVITEQISMIILGLIVTGAALFKMKRSPSLW